MLAHMTGWTESDELDVTDLLIKFAKLGLDYNQLFEVLVNRDDEETNQFIMVVGINYKHHSCTSISTILLSNSHRLISKYNLYNLVYQLDAPRLKRKLT